MTLQEFSELVSHRMVHGFAPRPASEPAFGPAPRPVPDPANRPPADDVEAPQLRYVPRIQKKRGPIPVAVKRKWVSDFESYQSLTKRKKDIVTTAEAIEMGPEGCWEFTRGCIEAKAEGQVTMSAVDYERLKETAKIVKNQSISAVRDKAGIRR